MKRIHHLTLLVVLCSILCPRTARGDDKHEITFTPIPPGPDRIEVVISGAPAPFSGQLFDSPTALRWANTLQQCKARLSTDVDAERKIGAAQVGYFQRQLDIERRFSQEQLLLQQKQILDLQAKLSEPSPWYRSQWLSFAAGILLTTAAAGAGYAAFRLSHQRSDDLVSVVWGHRIQHVQVGFAGEHQRQRGVLSQGFDIAASPGEDVFGQVGICDQVVPGDRIGTGHQEVCIAGRQGL